MRRLFVPLLVAAALAAVAPPLTAQKPDTDAHVWQLEGLRTGFCIQLLLDPASKILEELPQNVRPLPASEVSDLHVSLKSVVASQPEFAAWSPSRLCFNILDTVRASDFTLADRTGKHPQLFATWTVTAAGAGGPAHDVVLELFANSSRLIRSAHLAGQSVTEARLAVGKVPFEDENGTPSPDDRIQVKLGKTTVTWDGHLAGDSAEVSSPVELAWTTEGIRGADAGGKVVLMPALSQPMAGSLKVDGKDTFAKALRSSPTRFVGPAYRGGRGTVTFN